MRSDILDQEIDYDQMIMVFAVDHFHDFRHCIRIAQIVERDPFGGGARKLIRVPGIHVSVFQDIAQRMCCAHDHLHRDHVHIIYKCVKNVLCIELLHTV